MTSALSPHHVSYGDFHPLLPTSLTRRRSPSVPCPLFGLFFFLFGWYLLFHRLSSLRPFSSLRCLAAAWFTFFFSPRCRIAGQLELEQKVSLARRHAAFKRGRFTTWALAQTYFFDTSVQNGVWTGLFLIFGPPTLLMPPGFRLFRFFPFSLFFLCYCSSLDATTVSSTLVHIFPYILFDFPKGGGVAGGIVTTCTNDGVLYLIGIGGEGGATGR